MAYSGVKDFRTLKKARVSLSTYAEQQIPKLSLLTYATVVSYKIYQTLYGTSGATLTSIS